MESAEVTEIIAASRRAAFLSDPSDALAAIDNALITTTQLNDRGKLYLARALAQQGVSNSTQAAADARESVRYLLDAGDRRAATFATACAAGMTQREGDTARSLDLAVDALVLLREEQFLDESLVRAANAMAVMFAQISAFDLAIESSRQAFTGAPTSLDASTRAAITYTLGYCTVEAIRSGTVADDARGAIEEDLDTIVQVLNSTRVHQRERAVLGTGMAAEQILLAFDGPGAMDESSVEAVEILEEVLDLLEQGTEEYDRSAPRLRAWHQLVSASVLLRLREPRRAKILLDDAIPALIAVSDEHRIVRALHERSEARALSGDLVGALEDARRVARLCREWQQHQGERLGAQVAHRADLEWGRLQLRRRTDELAKQASEDSLTGLATRRWLEKELDALGRRDGRGTVVILDLDNFKQINDDFGHQIGDDVLVEVGNVLRSMSSASISVARFGGEEFVVLLPSAELIVGEDLAQWVRHVVGSIEWHEVAEGLSVTISGGVAEGPLQEVREVLRLADMALYEAKRAGRDRIVTSTDIAEAA